MTDDVQREFVLLVFDGEASGREVFLPLDRPFRFGRKADADLQLLNDPKVSGIHAQLEYEKGHWILRDLDSTNGTFIDGRKVREVPIEHGDRFQIGATKIQLIDKTQGLPPAEEDMELQIGRGVLEKSAKKKGSLPLILLLLLVIGGGVAWYFLGQGGGPKRKQKIQKVVRLEGDLLDASAATLEAAGAEGAWARLRGGGSVGLGGRARSGHEALRLSFASKDEEGDVPKFSAAVLAKPLPVGRQQAFRARAFVQTHGELKVGLRLLFFMDAEKKEEGERNSEDSSVFRERPSWVLGKPLTEIPGTAFKELSLETEVPFGAVRVALALVALPKGEGASWADFDDMALVPGKKGVALAQQFAGRTIFVPDEARSSLMVRVGDKVLLRSVEALPPSSKAGSGWEALAKGLGLPLSSFFTDIQLRKSAEGVVFALKGEGRLRLMIPQEALDGGTFLLDPKDAKGKSLGFDRFSGGTKVAGFSALAIGEESSRMLLKPGRGGALSALNVQGGIVLEMDAPESLTFVFDFEEQIRQARKFLREGEAAEESKQFGKALLAYRKVLREVPFYDPAVRTAGERRAKLLNQGRATLDRLSESYEDARLLGYLGLIEELLNKVEAEKNLFQGTELEARFMELEEKAQKTRDSFLAIRSAVKAKELGEVFDALLASGSPHLAGFLGSILETSYPGTEEAKTRKAAFEELQKKLRSRSGKKGN